MHWKALLAAFGLSALAILVVRVDQPVNAAGPWTVVCRGQSSAPWAVPAPCATPLGPQTRTVKIADTELAITDSVATANGPTPPAGSLAWQAGSPTIGKIAPEVPGFGQCNGSAQEQLATNIRSSYYFPLNFVSNGSGASLCWRNQINPSPDGSADFILEDGVTYAFQFHYIDGNLSDVAPGMGTDTDARSLIFQSHEYNGSGAVCLSLGFWNGGVIGQPQVWYFLNNCGGTLAPNWQGTYAPQEQDDWTIYIHVAQDSTGWTALYRNGQLVYSGTGPNYSTAGGGSAPFVNFGPYKWTWQTGTTSRTSVAATQQNFSIYSASATPTPSPSVAAVDGRPSFTNPGGSGTSISFSGLATTTGDTQYAFIQYFGTGAVIHAPGTGTWSLTRSVVDTGNAYTLAVYRNSGTPVANPTFTLTTAHSFNAAAISVKNDGGVDASSAIQYPLNTQTNAYVAGNAVTVSQANDLSLVFSGLDSLGETVTTPLVTDFQALGGATGGGVGGPNGLWFRQNPPIGSNTASIWWGVGQDQPGIATVAIKTGPPVAPCDPSNYPSVTSGAMWPSSFCLYATQVWRNKLPDSPQNVNTSESANLAHYGSNGLFRFLDGTGGNAKDDFTHPIYFAKSTDQLWTITLTGGGGSNVSGVTGTQIRVPAGACNAGSCGWGAGGSDHHFTVIQPDGTEWDFWSTSISGTSISAPYIARSCVTGTGVPAVNGSLCGATTASGSTGPTPWSTRDTGDAPAGDIRVDELRGGAINHALALVLPCVNGLEFPGESDGVQCSNGVAMGAHIHLKWSDATIDSRYPASSHPALNLILHAYHQYGGIVIDTGGCSGISCMGPGVGGESPDEYLVAGNTVPIRTYGSSLGYSSDGAGAWTPTADPNGVPYSAIGWSNFEVLSTCYALATCST